MTNATPLKNTPSDAKKTQPKPSQATVLVEFAQQQGRLTLNPQKEAYWIHPETQQAYALQSTQFKNWLAANFYRTNGQVLSDNVQREAISTLCGIALHTAKQEHIYNRVAQQANTYYLDLAQADHHTLVAINAHSWQLTSHAGLAFHRSSPQQPMPIPTHSDSTDLSPLWQLINIPKQSRLLVTTWLLECWRPDTPFPVLELYGEQGSVKSTSQRLLRRLIDPNMSDLRAAPRNREDLFVSANTNWLVSLENISYLSADLQDAMCTLATGGGFAKRGNYTNFDEVVIDMKRPIIINGIAAAITAGDLIDRTLTVELPAVSARQPISAIMTKFEQLQAHIIGVLCNIITKALAKLPAITLPPDQQPRLYEFALFGCATAQAMGYSSEEFMSQFQSSRDEGNDRVINAHPVAIAIIEWFTQQQQASVSDNVKNLMQQIEPYRPAYANDWPRSPKAFGDALRRASPALRQHDITVESLGKIGGYYKWQIAKHAASQLSQPDHTSPDSPDSPDSLGSPDSLEICNDYSV